MTTIEDLPSDLFGEAVLMMPSAVAIKLAAASEMLTHSAAHTIAPWEEGGPFEIHEWHIREPAEVALLLERSNFVAEASRLSGYQWAFVVRCGSPLENGDIERLARVLPQVTALICCNCRSLTDDAAALVAAHSQHLRLLDFSGCSKLTNNAVASVVAGWLTSLNFRFCTKLTDAAAASIAAACKQLTSLDLSGCSKLTDAAVATLAAGCRRLRMLDITNCEGIEPTSRTKFVS